AFKKFEHDGEERLIFLENFFGEVDAAKSDIFRANERFLVELVFRIARMVILKELTTDKDYLLRLAKELIDRVGLKENIKVKINPEDSATIGMLKEGLEKAVAGLKNLSIEAS